MLGRDDFELGQNDLGRNGLGAKRPVSDCPGLTSNSGRSLPVSPIIDRNITRDAVELPSTAKQCLIYRNTNSHALYQIAKSNANCEYRTPEIALQRSVHSIT